MCWTYKGFMELIEGTNFIIPITAEVEAAGQQKLWLKLRVSRICG